MATGGKQGLMLIPYHPQRMLDKNTGENKFSNGYSEYKHKISAKTSKTLSAKETKVLRGR